MVTATIPDLLRLLVVPVFGWAAIRDIRTRRVPNRTWFPLAALGLALLAWDVWLVTSGETLVYRTLNSLLLRTALSVGLIVPFAYGFWLFGGFGGADAKALMTLAVVFPAYPHYFFDGFALPIVETTIGVFSLTILSNTVLAGVAYPAVMAVRNAVDGHLSKLMFIGRRDAVTAVPQRYGRLLERPDGYTRSGMDLDVLRMYLSWRDCSLAELRDDPERFRDPETLPSTPGEPGDGTVPRGTLVLADGGEAGDGEPAEEATPGDPWGAEAFFESVGGALYGTGPEDLRDGLEVLTENDEVWYSPGLPFIVPMFAGLLISLAAGDVLVWLLGAVGLA